MPFEQTLEVGVPTRVTATYTGNLSIGTSGTRIGLVGIQVGAGATAPTVQIWHGQTTAAGATLIGVTTCALNSFTRIPAYCSGGATFYVSGITTPDLTIYWNPLG